MARTAVIVQARMSSSRLPGKVMMDLAGETVLSHVVRRCRAIAGADAVVVATGDGADDDVIAAAAPRLGAAVYRGSVPDVLARYAGAARMVGAEVVMRVTSDCPLIDPEVCGAVLTLREAENADYACNNMPPEWPHGLDCEAFPAARLFEAEAQARQPDEREHVTPWLRRHPDLRRASLRGRGLPHYRLTLDYPEDLAMFRALFALLPGAPALPGIDAVVAVLRAHPEIAALNAMHAQPRG